MREEVSGVALSSGDVIGAGRDGIDFGSASSKLALSQVKGVSERWGVDWVGVVGGGDAPWPRK